MTKMMKCLYIECHFTLHDKITYLLFSENQLRALSNLGLDYFTQLTLWVRGSVLRQEKNCIIWIGIIKPEIQKKNKKQSQWW